MVDLGEMELTMPGLKGVNNGGAQQWRHNEVTETDAIYRMTKSGSLKIGPFIPCYIVGVPWASLLWGK